MSLGPGKYDEICTSVREATRAEGAVVIIVRGEHGNGFSCQAAPEFTLQLPEVLRRLADLIEKDVGDLGWLLSK